MGHVNWILSGRLSLCAVAYWIFTASFYLLVVALVCCRGGLCEAASWEDDHHLPFVGSGQHPAASALVSLDDALQPFILEAGPIPSREPRKSRT